MEERASECPIEPLEQEPVLDKIRAEIKEKFEGCDICEWFDDYDYEDNNISEYRFVGSIDMVLDIINKYRVESEDKQIDDEIRVGDEIENDTRGKAIVLYKEPYGLWHCIYSLGAFSLLKERQSLWHKTGRHFDEIEEVLKQLQEDKE